ncbi:uncharacterized protein [Hyperolius riggenbachi]|uniref:uncharacterized protein isoform X2 n=1 Tax=Hyperolius riggenbachi TaxID=752182 RepID=UPI0035A2E263
MITWLCLTLHLSVQHFAIGKMLVSQDPNNVTHHPGDTATVTCRWNYTNARRIRVNWTKYSPSEEENGTELSRGLWPSQKNMTTMDHNRSSCTATNNRVSCTVTNDTSVMTLHPVTENDSGLYICHITIEIPVLDAGRGNGLFKLEYLYFIILVIIPIVYVVYCLYRKWKKRKELHLDHVYGNMMRNAPKSTKSASTKSTKSKSNKKTSVV